MRLLAAVPAALLALAASRLLPSDGVGLGLRLGVATLVLLLPGLLLARALGRSGASASLAWALAALFLAMTAMFALGSSTTLALAVLAAVALAAAPFAVRGRPAEPTDRVALAVAGAGLAFGAVLWRVASPLQGDALFHLGRVRKLVSLDELSLESVNEFADGGLHPGYAFPLWHGFLALVARLAGVDPSLVVRHEASVLAPLALAIAYEGGRVLFRSRPAGIAVMLAQVALIALAPAQGGSYTSLALPATASRQLLVVAVLVLVFELVETPSKATVATVGAATLALALVHPTYAVFVLVPIAGFVVVRALVEPADAKRLALAVAAVAVPTAAVSLWLLPIVRETVSHNPTADVRLGSEHGVGKYPGQLDVFDDGEYRVAPEVLGRAGSVAVAGLVLVPLAGLARRRRWAAFVLGGSLAVLAVCLIPELFTRLADAASLSQARRAAGFVPFAFAVAGGAAVLARLLGWFVLPVALVAGVVLQRLWPGDFGYRLDDGGPALAAWTAVAGGAVAAVAAVAARRWGIEERRGALVAVAVALFVTPVAWDAAARWDPRRDLGPRLSEGLVDALRAEVPPRSVVLADLRTSYRVAALAPVYVAAAPPSHVADTERNRPRERARDVNRYLARGSEDVLRRYRVGYVVIDRSRFDVRPRGRLLYRDDRYSLYRV